MTWFREQQKCVRNEVRASVTSEFGCYIENKISEVSRVKRKQTDFIDVEVAVIMSAKMFSRFPHLRKKASATLKTRRWNLLSGSFSLLATGMMFWWIRFYFTIRRQQNTSYKVPYDNKDTWKRSLWAFLGGHVIFFGGYHVKNHARILMDLMEECATLPRLENSLHEPYDYLIYLSLGSICGRESIQGKRGNAQELNPVLISGYFRCLEEKPAQVLAPYCHPSISSPRVKERLVGTRLWVNPWELRCLPLVNSLMRAYLDLAAHPSPGESTGNRKTTLRERIPKATVLFPNLLHPSPLSPPFTGYLE